MWSDVVKAKVATSLGAYICHRPWSLLEQAGFKLGHKAQLILWFICLWKWWHSIESAVSVMLRSRHATAEAFCHRVLLICVFSRLLTPLSPLWREVVTSLLKHVCHRATCRPWYWKHAHVGQLHVGRFMRAESHLASVACRRVSRWDRATPQAALLVKFPVLVCGAGLTSFQT